MRALIVWVLIMCAETVHGILRTLFIAPRIGDFRARQLAVFTASLIILAIATATIRWMRAEDRRALWTIGFVWVLLTLAFEVLLGHFVFGFSWSRIGSDYDLFRGGLMPIGLAIMAGAPAIAARLRGIPDHVVRTQR
jgi:hypothetical protein